MREFVDGIQMLLTFGGAILGFFCGLSIIAVFMIIRWIRSRWEIRRKQ